MPRNGTSSATTMGLKVSSSLPSRVSALSPSPAAAKPAPEYVPPDKTPARPYFQFVD
jgi:hypothetical protein